MDKNENQRRDFALREEGASRVVSQSQSQKSEKGSRDQIELRKKKRVYKAATPMFLFSSLMNGIV